MSKCRFNNPTVKEQSNNDEELSTIPKYNRNAVRYGSENDSEDLNELERVISSHIPKNLKIRTYNSRLSYEKIKIRGPQGKTLMQREQEFLELLSQLTDRDTQDQAYHQILKLFSQNAKDRDCLQLYLNTLVNKNRCMSGLLNTEYEVILLTNLISMCEGNKNNESTIDNIVSYLNVALCQDSSGVAEAVAQCYMHILEYLIIPKFGVNIQTICDLLLNPLSTLFNGEDRISQKGAIHCLFFILRGSKDENRRELFRFLYKFIIKHFIGSAVINEEYFDCISYCIQYGRVNNIARYVVPIIDICLKCLSSSESFSNKTLAAACYLLGLISKHFSVIKESLLHPLRTEILSTLENFIDSKEIKLKNEAIKAYNKWSVEEASDSNFSRDVDPDILIKTYKTDRRYYVSNPHKCPYHTFRPFTAKGLKDRTGSNKIKIIVDDKESVKVVPRVITDLQKTQKLNKYSKSVYNLIKYDDEVAIRNVGFRPISSYSKGKISHRK